MSPMGITHLSPGFRFYPTDIELIMYHLKRKILGKRLRFHAIAEVDIYKFSPWDLPDKSNVRSGDLKWYFFCPREKKYASGVRLNRATESGYWKTTGKDRPVLYNDEVAGMIKTLIFHLGKAPRGERTDWVMHEYRLEDRQLAESQVAQHTYVLCAVFKKAGPGPKNGAQYGAPFKEEDWSDDEEDNAEAAPSAAPPVGSPEPATKINCAATCLCPFAGVRSESRTHAASSSVEKMVSSLNDPNNPPMTIPQAPNDDIASMLDFFTEEDGSLFSDHNEDEMAVDVNLARSGHGQPCSEGMDIFSGLADLNTLDEPSKGVHNFPGSYSFDEMVPAENDPFLELLDLDNPLNHVHEESSFVSCNSQHDTLSQSSCQAGPSHLSCDSTEQSFNWYQPAEPHGDQSDAFQP